MGTNGLMSVLLLAPLIGFFINGLRFKSKNYQLAGTIATAAVGLSFVCSVIFFIRLLNLPPEARSLAVSFFDWLQVGQFSAQAGFVVDAISSVMILIITGVGTLIHLFSIGYMSHDERPSKYFAYLNFFVFNMLLLVLGDNLLVMFVGWEGVGLCSYLLIGFWFSDEEKAAAGMKAFITNRIGDAGFLMGIFTLFAIFGTINFSELATAATSMTAESGWGGLITIACLFLFVGATGKSAQIPLHVWLPDAMAGPTPVSALIHAATMVTAGVYMIVRLNPVFMLAPSAMHVIAVIGALTALLAATIGMTQWDIKKVLAYSTVSQLGYMFLAVGVGAFSAAMFHLMTHAFFKALMFLGSGSVIHSMSDEQDMRKMGGLKKFMPITHFTFCCGWVAIIGVPPFAGFFSKDEILWQSFSSPLGHWSLWLMGVLAAIFTAFYMTRLMCLTFWGGTRHEEGAHPHESPSTMTIPLIILAVLSVFAGLLGIPHVIGNVLGHLPNVIGHWLEPAMTKVPAPPADHALEWGLMSLSVALALLSSVCAFQFYILRKDLPGKITAALGDVYAIVNNKYFVDEAYFGRIINPLVHMSKGLWLYIDVNFIDKTTYVVTDLVKGVGEGLRAMQNGNLQQYASYVLFGIVGTLLFIVYQMGL